MQTLRLFGRQSLVMQASEQGATVACRATCPSVLTKVGSQVLQTTWISPTSLWTCIPRFGWHPIMHYALCTHPELCSLWQQVASLAQTQSLAGLFIRSHADLKVSDQSACLPACLPAGLLHESQPLCRKVLCQSRGSITLCMLDNM